MAAHCSQDEQKQIMRQRLLELERKHAKALRKLKRAEITKQRRQTFGGFTVQEETTYGDAQNRSSISLSRESFSPGDANSSSLSAHKKGFCKTVTFRDVVETHQQPLCERKSENKNEIDVASSGTSKQRSALVELCKQNENVSKIAQICVGSNNIHGFETDNMWVTSCNDDIVLCDNAVLPENSTVISEHKDFSKSEVDQGQTLRNAACSCGNEDVQIPSRNNENSESTNVIYFDNCGKEMTATSEVVEPLSIGTVSVFNPHALNNEGIQECLAKGQASEKAAEAPEKKNSISCPSVHENGSLSLESRHWMHLFEEEFPRRSPRLQSTPSFGKQSLVSKDCYSTQSKKTKSYRSKQSRPKKGINSQSKSKTMKCSAEQSSVTLKDNSHEQSLSKGFVFPRPSSDEAKPGGPLGIIVDFSLPDKEFAKLKLAKIKAALPAERISRELNNKSTVKVKEHDTMPKREKALQELSGGEIKEDCSHNFINSSIVSSMQFDSTSKPDELESVSITDTSDRKSINQAPQFISTSGNLESQKNSEHCVNQFSSSPKHQYDLQLKHEQMNNSEVDFSPRETLQENPIIGVKPCLPYQVDEKSVSEVNIGEETSSITHSTCDIPLKDGVDDKIDVVSDSGDDNNKEIMNTSDLDDGALDKNFPHQCGHEGPKLCKEISNDRQPKFASNSPEKDGVKETKARKVSCEADSVIYRSQPSLLHLEEQILSPSCPEPSVGEQATPHGKMTEPLESSQSSCLRSLEDQSELTHMLMMACLQHHMEGECNVVRSVSLSSYEPASGKDVTVPKMKRDVLAVCLAHLIVIWTVVPGLQWTVLYKWSLPSDGVEEFVSVQVVPRNSHVVLLVGGNFCGGNGRILGYSDDGDYTLDLKHDDTLSNKHKFSTMCLLSDSWEKENTKDIEFVIANRESSEVALTKWTLDSFCLVIKQRQYFTPIITESELSSIQAVEGSHCLLLGTTQDQLLLWNHKTCQELRTISLRTQGLGQLFCLKASTERGLLFLMMAGRSGKEIQCGERNYSCLLLALNPKTSQMVCLERFFPINGFHTIGTSGQYIAAGGQATGEVNLWNITKSRRLASMKVFQDKVSSVGFHRDWPVVAFGSASGCVHLFSIG